MKKRFLSPLSVLGLLLLPLLLVAADPSATHLLYLDPAGHPLQDIDLSGPHVSGTLSADRLPAALHPASITASGTQLSLRAAAPHERFLQLADPAAGTEYLTFDALEDGSPVLNVPSAPALRVRAAAADLLTVWASGGVSVGTDPYDPGAGCLALSQSVFAAGDLSAAGHLSVSGSVNVDSGGIISDGVGDLYANDFVAPTAELDTVTSTGVYAASFNSLTTHSVLTFHVGGYAFFDGAIGAGTVPSGMLQVKLDDDTAPAMFSAWDTRHAQFGQSGATGAGLGVSYQSSANTVHLFALQPGTGWKTLRLNTAAVEFFQAGGSRAMTVAHGVSVGSSGADPGTGNLAVAGAASLAPQTSAPSAPASGVTLYVDAAGDLHALHANGTNHVLSAH